MLQPFAQYGTAKDPYVAGVLGIGALIAGLSLSFVGAGATWKFIDSGAPIVVTRVDGNRIVVQRYCTSTERS